MRLEEIQTGLYYCGGHRGPDRKPKPELDFAFVFVREEDSIKYEQDCFPPVGGIGATERYMAEHSVPLSRKLIEDLTERHGEGIFAWLTQQGVNHPELRQQILNLTKYPKK
jgi:hypothetical protein